MRYHERQEYFRRHAAATLRGDRDEAAHIQGLLGPDLALQHHLFVFALFASAVTDHFGDELDQSELAALMAELRATCPNLAWLRAEALIRVCYGESSLYLDVAQSEHWSLMWSVLSLIVPSAPGETTLAVLFDRADDLGRQIVSGIFEAERLFGWADEPDHPPEHREEEW